MTGEAYMHYGTLQEAVDSESYKRYMDQRGSVRVSKEWSVCIRRCTHHVHRCQYKSPHKLFTREQ